MADEFRHVFRAGRIGSLHIPHRIVMGAMHLGLETREDGGAALAAFYAERARGGAGLMITGGAAVSVAGAGGRGYGVLGDVAFRDRLRRVVTTVHDAGGLIALQLFHAGRYASPTAFGVSPVAPSAVHSRFSGSTPQALTAAQIRATVADFARAAALGRELGFDAVEIMGSEGYLVDQFLSPLTNLRDDEWGGDARRRRRFGVEVTRAAREATGADFPIVVRFTGLDLMAGGTPHADVLDFARSLVAAGADALNVGVGWHESPVPSVQAIVPPGAWISVAAAVKAAVGSTPVIASNRVNRVGHAEDILATSGLDFVSMARPFLADPELITRSRRRRPVNVCIGCNQACIDRSLVDGEVSCMVNPRAGRELTALPARSARQLRLAVIGGGPAGLQAAHALASAGHRVDLYEAADGLGGQFRLAGRVPGKADYHATIDYFTADLDRLGVRMHVGRPIGAGDVPLLRAFAGLIVASGVRPRRVEIPGADLPHVLTYPQAFAGGALRGRVAIIGGGGIAVDLAHLAARGPERPDEIERFLRTYGLAAGPAPAAAELEVTILHRGPRIGPRLGRSSRWAVLADLRRHGVRIVSGVRFRRITSDGVHIVDAAGADAVVPADTVVIAAGQTADGVVPALARQAGVWHRVVGGARDADGLDAVRAFAEGFAVTADVVAELEQLTPAVHTTRAGRDAAQGRSGQLLVQGKAGHG
ncbi:oxidoreductase [Micromonospora coxensis]|uniref:2,4-dienoyl-CoA reductase (NADPH2) n=1 Tax=Micromonospora coxensis TaxID=356852 RepID=A0A1C5K2F2_9ACTN|nr:FAD-dependent oxidoreductase [Micromonospora coxensis]SCG76962.1 2,4-dienoyl-CoA reductase (NADPH2) [Micromonospora coxensis]